MRDQASSPSCKKKKSMCSHFVGQQITHPGERPYKCLHCEEKFHSDLVNFWNTTINQLCNRNLEENQAFLALVSREWCVNNAVADKCAASFLGSALWYACTVGGCLARTFRLPELLLYLNPHWSAPTWPNAKLHLHTELQHAKSLFILTSLSPIDCGMSQVRLGPALQPGCCITLDGHPGSTGLASPLRKWTWKHEHRQHFIQMTITGVLSCKPFQLNYFSEK